MNAKLLASVLWLCSLVDSHAGVTMPGSWSDHMVLQRDQPILIWGRGDPGHVVEVRFNEQVASAVTDEAGEWRVTLDPMDAGGPYSLVVLGAKEELRFADILVGDVWLCSGQSNMYWPLSQTDHADKAIAASADSGLRLYMVPRKPSPEPQTDTEGQWLRSGPDTAGDFSGVAYYFGRKLRAETGVPIGLIQSAVGGTPAEAWTRRAVLEADPRFASIMTRYERALARWPAAQVAYEEALAEWQERVRSQGREAAGHRPAPPMSPTHRQAPGALYNGMIAPLTSFPLRGVLWYQGEANRFRAEEYRALLPAMLNDWRRQWGIELPVGIVQLAAYHALQTDPNDHGLWPWLREAQADVATHDPLAGLVVTIDVGDQEDIHPRDKKTVGERLARWALATVYGRDIVYRGPTFRSMHLDNGTVVCEFDHIAGGLVATERDHVPGFAVAGEDRVFHWADATIEGNRVWVGSSNVAEPVAVRYAWGDYPPVGLFHAEGLPAVPFRTDQWGPSIHAER